MFNHCFYVQLQLEVPPGWIVAHSSKLGKDYYFNTVTKESRWEFPEAELMVGPAPASVSKPQAQAVGK